MPFLLLLAALVSPLYSQVFPLPPATLGVPYSFNYGEGLDQIPTSGPGYTLTFFFTTTGTLPPGITMTRGGLISGVPTQPGTFNFDIIFTYRIDIQGIPPFEASYPTPFSITVSGGSGPPTTVEPRAVVFSLSQGSGSSTQSIGISNRSATPRTFSASASTGFGGNWLSISPSTGTVAPFGSAGIAVSANPANLPPGTYAGTVTVGVGNDSFTVSVIATVAGTRENILLSQTGLRFQAVTGGSNPPPQAFNVLNSGAGNFSFVVTRTTVTGGSWLSVSPAAGTTGAASGVVTVSVNPAGLAAGDYYGTIQVESPGVANSPQSISVVLNVVPPDQSPGAQASPTGLIFVGALNSSSVAAKTITLNNPSPRPLNFSTNVTYESGNNWLTVQPPSGTLTGTSTVTVTPRLTGLASGLYKGEVSIRFVEDASIRRVAVLLIVLPAGSTPTTLKSNSAEKLATNCTPTKLIPVFTRLGAGFSATAAWPVNIETTVVDDCGDPLMAGSVTANFSSGDPALSLTSLRDGRWTGTWQPRTSASQVTVTVTAQQIAPRLEGKEFIGGALQANRGTPLIAAGGVVSAANGVAQAPLAPGSFISIYGSNLSQGLSQSPTVPYVTQLNQTSVVMAGRQLPIQIASDNQINAIVPYDTPVNTTQQVIVQRGSSLSLPESVVVAAAQPAVFTYGEKRGIIFGYKPDGTPIELGKPVAAGDVLVIYSSGLGAVDPAVPAGAAAPSEPLSRTVNAVTLTIGGKEAQVLFSGLAPGFPGVYQVNAVVPAGVEPGDAQVTLTVMNQNSAPVTLPVQ